MVMRKENKPVKAKPRNNTETYFDELASRCVKQQMIDDGYVNRIKNLLIECNEHVNERVLV